MRVSEKILNLLYPPALYCICCGNLIDSSRTYHLCDHCIRHIRWDYDPPEVRYGMKMLRCAQYGIYERTLIFSLKYNRKKYIARAIGEMLADRLVQAGVEFDVIVPVPMNKGKEKERGFNQTTLVGKYLAETTGRELLENCLIRTRYTRPMRGLSPTERQANIHNSMALSPEYTDCLCGKRVLLVDDFYTTGSTALECKRVLMAGQPKEVLFIAFAAK